MISPFIHGLPKAELHMHLEGSLEPETLVALAQRHGVRLPFATAEALRAAYDFKGLQSFLDLYHLGLTVLRTQEDFRQMTDAYLARAARDSVRYAEVFLAPQAHLHRGIAPEVFMEGVLSALEDGPERHGVRGKLIAVVQRQFDEAGTWSYALGGWPAVCGLGALFASGALVGTLVWVARGRSRSAAPSAPGHRGHLSRELRGVPETGSIRSRLRLRTCRRP